MVTPNSPPEILSQKTALRIFIHFERFTSRPLVDGAGALRSLPTDEEEEEKGRLSAFVCRIVFLHYQG